LVDTDPEYLPAVACFARVAEHGSFSKAAAMLGVSPSALSQTIRGLESRLGVRLLNRTTRKVSTTEAGAMLLQRVVPLLAQFSGALSELEELRGKPSGTLRISLPRMALATVVAPLLAQFSERYPQIRLDLIADDRFVDLVGENYDAGIRLGERLAKDMVAVRATDDQRMVVVGSPHYFERHGRPVEPLDLHAHACLRFRFSSGALYRWEFAQDGKDFEMDVDGPLICNDNSLLVTAARDGVGLLLILEDYVRKELENGQLIRVLENWCPSFPGFYLYYPSRSQMPLKLRALVDFVSSRIKDVTRVK
jgi:DNA-binding transcriptional LysR family regulator